MTAPALGGSSTSSGAPPKCHPGWHSTMPKECLLNTAAFGGAQSVPGAVLSAPHTLSLTS